MEASRREIRIRGSVQGIGFRPWGARLARALELAGSIRNASWGVEVALEGLPDSIDWWLDSLRRHPPEGARLEAIEVQDVPCTGVRGFAIRGSTTAATAGRTRIPADRPLCPECVGELFTRGDRRYRYPFTHCASCGPRAAVLRALPYDRERTTLRPFPPCAECRREYADLADRRFHAESIACPACGPRLTAHEGGGRAIDGEAIEAAAACVRAGGVVALQGYGGFHLVCDATRAAPVAELRRRKARPTKPFAVMVPGLAAARALVRIEREDEAWLTGPAHAVVIAPRRAGGAGARALASLVAPRTNDLGLILPVAPLHWLLLYGPGARPGREAARFEALVFTSANVSEAPTLWGEDAETQARLDSLADLVVTHDRAIARPSDDPVVRSAPGGAIPIRLSRSTAPLVLPVAGAGEDGRCVLAVGGDLKAAPAVRMGDEVVLGEHVGDLANPEAADALEARAVALCQLLGVTPTVVAHDLHPDYVGTALARRLAKRWNARTVAVQHHHAHAVAAAVEHGLETEALAWVLDGAGFGPDGTVWGGELLRFDAARATRLAHLETVPLPGGDAAVREPWRMAWAWLRQAFPEGDAPRIGWRAPCDEASLKLVTQAVERGIASPLTSSCGRLFDAVASLLGLGDRAHHEGELASALEALAEGASATPDEAPVVLPGGPVVRIAPLLREIALGAADGAPAADLAKAFHTGLAERLAAAAHAAARETGVRRVIVTGGCLQNRLLRGELVARIARRGLDPLVSRRVPPNDGGLAVGQAVAAAAH